MKNNAIIYTLIWTMVIIYLSLSPASGMPKFSFLKGLPVDKIVHFTMYFIHSFLLIRVYKFVNKKNIIIVFLVSFTLGLTIEIIQSIPAVGRSFEFLDIVFNGVGSVAGIGVTFLMTKKINKA